MLKLSQILNIFKGRQEKQDIEKIKEELFVKVARLKKLTARPEWKEYVALLEEYIDQCRIQKLKYNFAHAYMIKDEKTFRHAAFLDNDIDFATKLLNIADDFKRDIAEMEKQDKEREKDSAEDD